MSLDKCRLCANPNAKGHLNLRSEKTGEMLKKINSCLNFQVTLEKNLSHMVCKECYTKVINFNTFQVNTYENEINLRNAARLQGPIITREDTVFGRQTLTKQGIRLISQNIGGLSDKVASLNQERDLLRSKIENLQKENDILRTTVIQHSKTLPEITRTMTSLLSRMEQQFILSNSKIVNGGASEEVDDNEEAMQMDSSYDHLLAWTQSPEPAARPTVPQISYIANPPSTSSRRAPQVAYVCDTITDHVTEVEIDCDAQSSPPSPSRGSDSGTPYEEERAVDDLLVQLCEQQEKHYNKTSAPTPVKLFKTDHYELIVPRKSVRKTKT